jgi:hypothetical protein
MTKNCVVAMGGVLVLAGALGCSKSGGKPTGGNGGADMARPPTAQQDLSMPLPADLGPSTPDLLGHLCNSPYPGGCCDANNMPKASPTCDEHGGWVCPPDTSLCRCGDDLETFGCTDFCGSDEFLSPECVNGKWTCDGATPVRTDLCKAGTCWGLPAECCDLDGHYSQIECHDGQWSCPGKWCYLFDGGVH